MIVRQIVRMARVDTVAHRDPFVVQVDGIDFAVEKIGPLQELADRVDDGRDVEIAGRDLVQHRREQEKVVAVYERDLDGGIIAKPLLEFQCGVDPAEAAAEDEDFSFLRHFVKTSFRYCR